MGACTGFARSLLVIAFFAVTTFAAHAAAPTFVPLDDTSIPEWLPGADTWHAPNVALPSPDGIELDPLVPAEAEPNDTPAAANALALAPGGSARVQGRITSVADVDVYSFVAQPGDRLYATTITSTSLSNFDTILTVLAADGTTLVEQDDDNGSLGSSSSVVAGTPLAAGGTYYIRVGLVSGAAVRPYVLYVHVRRDAPVAEAEPNDLTPQVVPNGASVQGTVASPTDVDLYSVTLAEGETFVLMVDADPERDNIDTTLAVAMGPFAGQLLTADDSGGIGPDAEALAFTATASGTYTFGVLGTAAGASGSYRASTTIVPALARAGDCFVITQATPLTIIAGGGESQSSLMVPFAVRIEDVDVQVEGFHANMQDLDVSLVSPGGARTPLWDDLGSPTFQNLSLVLDDEAATPPITALLAGQRVQPEAAYRLSTFDDVDAQGTWALRVFDDTANSAGGQITSWSLRMCGRIAPSCPSGTTLTSAYATNFEVDAAGFTHAGTADEWARGTPVAPTPFTDCASGTQCFKTDLAGTYNANSSQDLLSPPINLAGLMPPIVVRWSHRFQMESATFDHYTVDAVPAVGASVRLWDWSDYTAVATHGTAATQILVNAGWAAKAARADALAGGTVQLRFHVDSDGANNFQGVAIDDVSVLGCAMEPQADLAITIDNGATTVQGAGSTTYTIVATNTTATGGNAPANVTVDFDAQLICTWNCFGSGAICSTSGSGDIADAVVLAPSGTATFVAACSVPSNASGSVESTASVAVGLGVVDPDATDNIDSDSDIVIAAPDALFANGFE